MKVLFTKRAEKEYLALKKYLILEWGENVATAFEQKTIDFLDLKNILKLELSKYLKSKLEVF